jgi:ABC-2 type transport system permease protein
VSAPGALAFLVKRSARNRLRSQVQRLKNIRYLFGLLFIIIYFGAILRPDRLMRARATPGIPGMPGSAVLGEGIAIAIAIGLVLIVGRWWVMGGSLAPIGLSRAEAQLLLPAPLSRQQLMIYKFARAHLAILMSAVILTLVMSRRNPALPILPRLLSYFTLFATLQLHQVAATLTRSGGRPAGAPAKRREWLVGIAAAVLVTLTLGVSVARVWPAMQAAASMDVWLGLLGDALSSRPASVLLWPFRAVVAPLSATSMGEWWSRFPIAVAILLVHYPWALLTTAPFEEAAVAAGERRERVRAAFRARRSGRGSALGTIAAARAASGKKTTVSKSWFRLAPVGRAWVAVVWKNTVPVTRQLRWVTLLLAAIGFSIVPGAIAWSSIQNGGSMADAIVQARNSAAIVALAIAAFSIVLGPVYARNDFRGDLPYLRVLRTYPVSSASLVGAEILASASVLFTIQVVMLIIAWLAPVPGTVGPTSYIPSFGGRTVIFVSLLVVAAVMDLLGVAVRNAVALFFPGWVKLGNDAGGVESIGYNVLGTVGGFFLLALLFVVPAGAVFGVLWATHDVGGSASISVAVGAAVVFVVLVALEVALLFRWLGGVYDDIDAGELLEPA